MHSSVSGGGQRQLGAIVQLIYKSFSPLFIGNISTHISCDCHQGRRFILRNSNFIAYSLAGAITPFRAT